jgi:hypothetical protein
MNKSIFTPHPNRRSWIYCLLSIITGLLIITTLSPVSHAQDVENFYFSSFHADYDLWRDDEGRSRMRVTETLVAEFPVYDQNKGLVRELPISFNNRPLQFELESLKRNGNPEPIYETSRSGGMKRISTGTDEYLRGTQEYKLVYTLRDVTEDFGDYQELFWNVNGTGWRQPFESVSAQVTLSEDIAKSFTGEVVCFEGLEGAKDSCAIGDVSSSSAEFSSTSALSIRENVSFALKFEPGTFSPFIPPSWQQVIRYSMAIAGPLIAAVGTYGAIKIFRRHRDKQSGSVIPREYIPPKNLSVLKATKIYKKPKALQKAVTAQLLELAVQRKIKIIESKNQGIFGRFSKKYSIEVTSTDSLAPEVKRLLKILFSREPDVGDRKSIKRNDRKVAIGLERFQKMLEKQIVVDGYREQRPTTWPFFGLAVLGFSLSLGMLIYSVHIGYGFSADELLAWSLPASIVLGGVTILLLANHLKRPTEQGSKIINHIKGLDEYISLAEAERLRFHQSPEGAQRQQINPDNKEEVLRLYERLLPYAVILGHEKDWYKIIGRYYEDVKQAPGWYVGASSFNARQFTTSMSSLSTTATSSTGSGFSGGAGSGGGGGGGGGGGR